MSSPMPLFTSLAAEPASTVSRAVAAVVRFVRVRAKAIVNRQDVGRMLDLDDRMLADIGLVRADVLGALAGSIAEDPSHVLCLRHVDTRVRQRAYEAHARRVRSV